MSDVPQELKYTESHEWVSLGDNGEVTVGISDHAQDLLGDIVYVDLPETGIDVARSESCVVVESVKAASDIYAPVSGEIIATNSALEETPELINTDPYGEGWIFRMMVSDAAELEELLDADAYTSVADES